MTTLVVVGVAAYTAFTAWDMRTTLEEEGCEVFLKEHGGVDQDADLKFYNKEELQPRDPEPVPSDPSPNYSKFRK